MVSNFTNFFFDFFFLFFFFFFSFILLFFFFNFFFFFFFFFCHQLTFSFLQLCFCYLFCFFRPSNTLMVGPGMLCKVWYVAYILYSVTVFLSYVVFGFLSSSWGLLFVSVVNQKLWIGCYFCPTLLGTKDSFKILYMSSVPKKLWKFKGFYFIKKN